MGAQTFTMSVGQNFPPEPGLYVASDFTPVALPDIPANGMVTRVQLSGSGFCWQPPAYILALSLNIPSSSGTPPPTNPPQTVPPTTTPTTPTTVPPGSTPVVPSNWFSTTNNFLKSKTRHDSSTPEACLGSDAQGTNVVPAPGVQDLSFRPAGSGYRIVRGVLSNERCLMVTSNRSPVAFDPTPGNGNALILEWRLCSDAAGGATYLDDTFTFTANDTQSASAAEVWVKMRPLYNYPGWNDPCIRLWNSASAVLQFKCQSDSDVNLSDELWAPVERFPTGPTNPRPNPPTGAKLFTVGDPTPIERVTDLACMSERPDGTYTFLIGEATDCEIFTPQWENGGWKLYQGDSPGLCLGLAGGQGPGVAKVPCSQHSAWLDQPVQSDGLSFPLAWVSPSLSVSNACIDGLRVPVQLSLCDAGQQGQLFYDFLNWCNLLGFESCFWEHWMFKWAVGDVYQFNYQALGDAAADLLVELTIGGCINNGLLSKSCAFDVITAVPITKVGKATKLIKAVKVADDTGDAAKIASKVPDLRNAIDDVLPQITQNRINGNLFRDELASELLTKGGVSIRKELKFQITSGDRFIDVVEKNLATGKEFGYETKIGRTSNSEYVKNQLKKDLEILSLADKPLETITWRFGLSSVTGLGGPTKPLLDALKAAASKGIRYECIPPISC